ncbi:hypothetical protein SKZ59_10045 [Janthinobacterium sp. GMG2]|uniref:hypothetical protein n=1 Tax=Janthinobacterium sp. GMG2 TaxID=3096606 RepID=UPI0029F4DB5A|nr:hypothetical protein [Janthinobacterium sp. GMG2]MDX8122115.1 hypothetical protein [Janthinobacterium sp. GMG2]
MLRSISTLLLLTVLAGKASAANIPDIVLEYAHAFAQTQAADEQASTPPADYAQWFFEGLTHPSGGIVTQSAAMRDAYVNGQRYWRDHPSERTNIMAGYGYRAIERDGVWSRGFEKSVFQPAHADLDSDAGAWWFNSFGSVAWRDVGLVAPNSSYEKPRVHIAGYLSPKGHYGHLGAYEHEVLVTSGVAVQAADH